MTEQEPEVTPRPRSRAPVVVALAAAAGVVLVAVFALAVGLPGSSPASSQKAPEAPAAAPVDAPAFVDAGWAAPGAGAPGAGDNRGNGNGDGAGNGNAFGRAMKAGRITITKIDGTKLSLVTVDGWTRTIDAAGAKITRGDETIGVADLRVGDEITFRQKRAADGSFEIVAIRVLMPKVGGTIGDVGSGSFVLTARDGTKTTVKVTAATTYRLGRAKADKAALVAGMQAVATGTKNTDGSLTATAVVISPSKVGGTIGDVGSSSFVLTARDGTKTTVKVTSTTTYRLGKAKADKAALVAGMQAVATGTKSADGSLTAMAVVIAPARVAGTVTAVSSSTITVKNRKGDTITVKVGSATTYRMPGVDAAKLADVKVDMWIVATGTKGADGSLTASAVAAGPAGTWGGWGDWKPIRGRDKASPAPTTPSSEG